VLCVIRHRVTTLYTSPSSLNLRPSRFCFSAGNKRQSLGDDSLWYNHSSLGSLVACRALLRVRGSFFFGALRKQSTNWTYVGTVTRWRSRLRHCATSRKVAGSIRDGVIGIFHWHNPSGRTMALGLTQPLSEMSTRNISWGVKVAGAWGWPYHLHVPTVWKSGNLQLLETSGPVQACNGIALPLRRYNYARTCYSN